LVPSLIAQLVFWPRYISELVGLSSFDVVWRVWAPMFLAGVPFAIATYLVGAFYPAHTLIIFFLQVIATLPIFAVTIGLLFRSYVRGEIFPRIRAFFVAEASV